MCEQYIDSSIRVCEAVFALPFRSSNFDVTKFRKLVNWGVVLLGEVKVGRPPRASHKVIHPLYTCIRPCYFTPHLSTATISCKWLRAIWMELTMMRRTSDHQGNHGVATLPGVLINIHLNSCCHNFHNKYISNSLETAYRNDFVTIPIMNISCARFLLFIPASESK